MKLPKVLSLALSVLLLSTVTMQAQNRTVTGTVVDTAGEPLIGVGVIISGTTKGVVTDAAGTFSLSVPAGEVTLNVTSLGYVAQDVKVPGTQATVKVILKEDTMSIEETVVVGYGTQKKVNLTGAITTVSSDDLKDRTTHNLTDMLQGSVPGLNISTSSGNPGSVGTLNIRGTTSISSGTNEPLVLIDGAVGELDRVNSADVESISVIKDAAAAAVYGARAAYGVILITTKSGSDKGGKATVRYSGHFGFEEPTTNTNYETRGYWSVYTVDTFWQTIAGKKYTTYTDADMAQLLARVNDKTENPDRPWVVTDYRNGRNQWVYYCNTDWWHEMFVDRHPVQQHNVSVSGGNKDVKYYISGGYDRQTGILKQNPDVFSKYNIRAKIDARLNKIMRLSNNTSFYSSDYSFVGVGNVQNAIQYSARHALASFPLKNPDGSWVYSTPLISGSYNVANGRHIVFGDEYDTNSTKRDDFSNTTELKITPFKGMTVTANYTYRLYQNRTTHRTTNFSYRDYPDAELSYYTTGAGLDELSEGVSTYNYYSANVFATYENTFAERHHFTATAGWNVEHLARKSLSATGQNLLSETLNDLDLVGPDATGAVITTVGGGQTEYALMGFFGRINYDYAGRYLFEVSGRYDGTSRFATGHKWGFFPSASFGWRVSEEPWFAGIKRTMNNLKFRASFGTLGNQNVSNYAYLRQISINDFAGYTFGEGTTMSKYASIGNPKAGDLTWETTYQYNIGIDLGMFNNRLNATAEAYIRDTKNMLVDGQQIPAVYGADAPQSNSADLRTRGYELSLSWKDEKKLGGKPFGYFLKASLSDYDSYITKYANNPNNLLNDYYVGMRIGDIWGFDVDGLFQSDQEAAEYLANVCNLQSGSFWSAISNRMPGGFQGGDLRFVDLDGDKLMTYGVDGKTDADGNVLPVRSLSNHGDLKILGNSLASLQYGFTIGFDYLGFDFSAFFQGTGNHYWYPNGFNYSFWGPYGYSYASYIPYNFYQEKVWTENNKSAYFPKARAYSSTGGELSWVNSYYLQNTRYLRFKNLTVGYTVPKKITNAIKLEKVRVYFTGENLCYWSPLKKVTTYLDPESAFNRASTSFAKASSGDASDHIAYPWQKSMMVGVDITF